MTRTHFEIERLDLEDSIVLRDAASVATRAFQFDAFWTAMLGPSSLQRARALGLFWRSELAHLGDRAEVYGARQGDRLVGVGAWIKPGCYPLPVGIQVRQLLASVWALSPYPPALVRGSKYLLAMEKAHPKEEHWYLLLLVADPAAQRGGVGTALQARGLEQADAAGLPAYLETQNPDNLPYYRRTGFEVDRTLDPVTGGPPLWTMRREVRG